MPLFNNSPFDGEVERATSELNATEDQFLFKEVCNRVKNTPNGVKDCLKSISKRWYNKVPHVVMQTLGLLDYCVYNAGRSFLLEAISKEFITDCQQFINNPKTHPKAADRLRNMMDKWLWSNDKTDSKNVQSKEGQDDNYLRKQKEEEDLATAIALSLKDTSISGGNATGNYYNLYSTTTASASSVYPSIDTNNIQHAKVSNQSVVESRKVQTLYDFEAVEDNELTFKAGEIISILDDSDPNWWKGCSWRGEGLFPANFVTADLTIEPELENVKNKKSVHFHEEVEVTVIEPLSTPVLEIDADKIDETLNLIQNADPSSEIDPNDLLLLEERCKSMGPLIDQELEKIDKKHITLMEYNQKLIEALQMYNSLMAELPNYGYVTPGLPVGQMNTSIHPIPGKSSLQNQGGLVNIQQQNMLQQQNQMMQQAIQQNMQQNLHLNQQPTMQSVAQQNQNIGQQTVNAQNQQNIQSRNINVQQQGIQQQQGGIQQQNIHLTNIAAGQSVSLNQQQQQQQLAYQSSINQVQQQQLLQQQQQNQQQLLQQQQLYQNSHQQSNFTTPSSSTINQISLTNNQQQNNLLAANTIVYDSSNQVQSLPNNNHNDNNLSVNNINDINNRNDNMVVNGGESASKGRINSINNQMQHGMGNVAQVPFNSGNVVIEASSSANYY